MADILITSLDSAMKVSVIVPVYNVRGFIEKCVHSLLSQTLEDVEYIFVDDCSPDDSMTILRKTISIYPLRQSFIHIVTHSENQGLPSARNSGLNIASGEYIFHCDSDDYVEPNMLETMYKKAIETQADIVWSDWFLSYGERERYMKQPSYSSSIEALKGILGGQMKYNVWNKLIRRSLYFDNNIWFPERYGMGEDMTIIKLFAFADKVAYLPHAFYHYVKLNKSAFSQTYSLRYNDELKYNADTVIQFLESYFGNGLDKEIAFFKLVVKYPFLISTQDRDYKLWRSWYEEANHYLSLNKNLSIRAFFLQWCACHNLFRIVKLYNLVIYRVLYRLLYQ